jgi:hypothetical protein
MDENNYWTLKEAIEDLKSVDRQEKHSASLLIKHYAQKNPNDADLISAIPVLLNSVVLFEIDPHLTKNLLKPIKKIKKRIAFFALLTSFSFPSYKSPPIGSQSLIDTKKVSQISFIQETNQNLISAIVSIGDPAILYISRMLEIGKDNQKEFATELLAKIGTASAVAALFGSVKNANKVNEQIENSLKWMLDKCKTKEEIAEFEKKMLDAYSNVMNKRKNGNCYSAGMVVARIKNLIAKRKNELTKDKGILLDDKPKPLKRRMYQTLNRKPRTGNDRCSVIRRATNG